MPTVTVDTSQLRAAADRLRHSGANADKNLAATFDQWAREVKKVMVEEVPVDSGETRDSITVERQKGLNASVGPTNRDKRGVPVGFFINYGNARQAPNDFLGRTAARAPALLEQLFDVSDVL